MIKKQEFWKKTSYFENDKLDKYDLYEYKKGKIVKVLRYNADDSFYGCKKIEYFSSSGKVSSVSLYDENDSLKSNMTYDGKTGIPVTRTTFNNPTNKAEKKTFVPFDVDGYYKFDNEYFLSLECLQMPTFILKAISEKDEVFDVDTAASIKFKKYKYNSKSPGYKFISEFNKENLLVSGPVLYYAGSEHCYCFLPNDDYELDINSCYEFEIIEKKKDYPSMNKSGKDKGPFGFDIGMTYEEVKAACGGVEPEHISDDRYIVKPKKTHPLFEKYIVWMNDKVGLYYVKAISRDIYVSEYGTEVKNQFGNLLSSLEKKYGKFEITDKVKSDYYFNADKYWMMALKDGARIYSANWIAPLDNLYGFDGLCIIVMGVENASQYSTDTAYIWIEYQFLNYYEAKQAEDDVL